jgi:hypothetical protein
VSDCDYGDFGQPHLRSDLEPQGAGDQLTVRLYQQRIDVARAENRRLKHSLLFGRVDARIVSAGFNPINRSILNRAIRERKILHGQPSSQGEVAELNRGRSGGRREVCDPCFD